MSVIDPIADLCTRIRNACMRQHLVVEIPYCKINNGIVNVLVDEGFVGGSELYENGSFSVIKVFLKYGNRSESVIRHIERVSKPGRRVYTRIVDVKPTLGGQGISILTTSKGVLSDIACRRLSVGGEVLCKIW